MTAARFPELDEDWNGGAFDYPVKIYIGYLLEA